MAALGGALQLGALPRFIRTDRMRDSLLMAVGLCVLALSRPYEGLLLCLPVGFVLMRWIFSGPRRRRHPLLVFPDICLSLGLPWCYRSLRKGSQILAAFFLVALCFGVARDWRLPAFQHHHFTEDAKQFASAPTGTAVTFQLNPAGWQMRLVKPAPGIGTGGSHLACP